MNDITKLKEQLHEAKLALQANQVFHTPIALRKTGQEEWDEYQIDAINRTKEVLGSMGMYGED